MDTQNVKAIPLQDRGIYSPQVTIVFLVDTSYVAGTGGGVINKGVYMFDNKNSPGQGSMELNALVRREDYIGFYIAEIDKNTGDKVTIDGFQISSGDVFGSGGYPQQSPDKTFWIAQAENASRTTYQVRCTLKTQELTPRTIHFSWDPFITAT